MHPQPDLLGIFLHELSSMLESAREAQESLEVNPQDSEALQRVESFFHRVAGTAPSVGLNLLGRLADVCERAAGLVVRGLVAPQEVLPLFSEGLLGAEDTLRQGGGSNPIPFTPPLSLVTNPEGNDSQSPRILVIDDDPFSAQLIELCLRDAGFRSMHCFSPQEALAKVADEAPDLIVLDVVMPKIDGFDLCRQIRRQPNAQFTPILFVTGRGDLEQRLRGLEAGANDYLTKPVEPRELVARVRTHLARTASLHELAVRDGLTGCYNNNYFKMRLSQEIPRAHKEGSEIALLMLDVDHFKQINDVHGHPAGDAVLAHIASLVVASVRGADLVARYGGEEFSILLTRAHLTEATLIAQRMCDRIAGHRFVLPQSGSTMPKEIHVTVSVGLTELGAQDTPEQLLARADAALYEAKAAGRNRVRVRSSSS